MKKLRFQKFLLNSSPIPTVFCLGFGCTSTMLYWLAERCLHWGVTGGRHCSHNCVMLMLALQCFDSTVT